MAKKRRDPGTGQLDLFLTLDEPAPPSPPPPPPSTPIPEPAMFSDQPTDPTLPPPPPPEVPGTPAPLAAQDSPPPASFPFDDCPPPPDTPPEVAADVRAMFLEEEERQRNEEPITIREGKPPLVTGIYRKPRPAAQKPLVMPLTPPSKPSPTPPPSSRPARNPARPAPSPRPATPSTTWSPGRPASTSPAPAPTPSSPAAPSNSTTPLIARLRNFFADAPLGRKGVIALLASILLVALLAWWLGTPKSLSTSDPSTVTTPEPTPDPTSEVPRFAGNGAEAPNLSPPAPPTSPAPTPVAATPIAPAIPLPSISGATISASADGSWLVRYDDPVFVSTDRISVEGMKALKATAAALLKLPKGATVTIHGHTDDIPPPPNATGPFRTNADLAAARAEVAKEHLHVFCKRLPRYTFTAAAPGTAPAPYPNDSDAHRRLNRTVTLQVTPVP